MVKNNKTQLIIMDIIQSYYTLPNKNNGAELLFLFNIGFYAWLIRFFLDIKESLLIKRDKPILNKNISFASSFLFDKV